MHINDRLTSGAAIVDVECAHFKNLLLRSCITKPVQSSKLCNFIYKKNDNVYVNNRLTSGVAIVDEECAKFKNLLSPSYITKLSVV